MQRFRMHRSVIAVLVLFAMLLQGTWVLAGTTGEITGTLIDTSSKKPIAGAKVTAISPSQNASATTDGQGRFSFLSLAPDTYAISVDAKGYQGTTLSGITVQADQVQTLALTGSASLQTIGRTSARATSDVVKAGETADVYSISAAQAAAAAPLGGGGSLSQAYSAIASVPGVFVPVGQQGWAQSVYVRGGNYTQLGYEYDGVPVQRAYDAYPSSTLSALGQQQVQVYTGSQPASAQSSGLAGFVNQVIKTGTYPGSATLEGSLGAPTFYHKLQLEIGGASPDRNFSYYLASAGYDQASRFVDQFDGASARYNYSTNAFAAVAQNCGVLPVQATPASPGHAATPFIPGTPGPNATAGCYQNGFGSAPNGYAFLPTTYGQDQFTSDRETVANLHFGIPHKKDGLKDDIQVLGSISSLALGYNDSYNALGGDVTSFLRTGALNYNGQTYQSCAVNPSNCASSVLGLQANCPGSSTPTGGTSNNGFCYNDRSIYTGPVGGALTAANVNQVSQYLFPSQPNGLPLQGSVNPNTIGNEKVNDGIFKFQYTHAMGSNAYARVYGYTLYSDWLNNDPNGSSNPFFAFVPSDYILPTHTKGLGFTVADQVGSHLFNLTGGYSTASLSRWNNGFTSTANPVAVLVDSTNPTGGCYSSSLALTNCLGSNAARYTVPGTGANASAGLQAHSNGTITAANAAGSTCGGGPCEYLVVGSGLNGSFNSVTPRFSNLTLSDSWNVTSKLNVDAAVRYDSFQYDIPSATTSQGPNPSNADAVARALFTNSYNAYTCYSPTTGVQATADGVCPAGTQHVAFNNANPTTMWYGGFQPRVGATYKLDPLNVLRVGYGRYLQPSSTAYTDYNRAGADIASYDVPKFYPYGFTSAAHAIPPEESWNLDFSWEHQVRGSDLSWKISPFARKTRNEDINVILDPTTNFVSAIPALASNIQGVELLVRKGDFSRNGFAGQLSYTYTHETSKYQTLPGGSTALDNVNSAVKNYNGFTSYCSSHPTDARCGASSAKAAPCYTQQGAPDPACGSTSIANPYWNAPVQSLFDPNANYYPYNQTFGTGFSSNASSYNIPHVAALILNYKHNRWAFTPTLQFSAGGRYGSPVMGIAMDPTGTCGAPLAGTTANDPRYPYGAVGGAPYDASTCAGFMTGPDPYTGKFDTPGSFVEPSSLVANLGITYEASKRLKLSLVAVNIYGTCFGGTQQAWTTAGSKLGCWYGAASGLQAGNFYNPGNTIAPQAYPYTPTIGGIAGQQAYGTNINPLQILFTAQVKM
jgi:hypothetical protein